MDWISVDNALPEHMQTVLTRSSKWLVVSIFFDSALMSDNSEEFGDSALVVDYQKIPYQFASQEIPGAVLIGVTHWCALPEAKDVA